MGRLTCKYVKDVRLIIKRKIHTGPGRSYVFNFQLLGIELSPNFVYQTNNNHWVGWQAGCWPNIIFWNNLKQFWKHWKHWIGTAPVTNNMPGCLDLLGVQFKCCDNNIIVPCSHWRLTPVTWKQLPSLALRNDFREMSAGQLPEVTATAGGYSDCWKLRRLLEAAVYCWKLRIVASEAHNMTKNALSILIVILSVQLRQTKTSDRKLCIFRCGSTWSLRIEGELNSRQGCWEFGLARCSDRNARHHQSPWGLLTVLDSLKTKALVLL